MNEIEEKFMEVQFQFMATMMSFLIKEKKYEIRIIREFEHMEHMLKDFAFFYHEFKNKTKK
jgi:hypothetical protein